MKLKKRNLYGFSLIETLMGILLTGLVSSALLLGITQTKLSIASIDARDRAYEELKVRTEALIGMAATNTPRLSGANSGQGERVTLIQNENDPDDPVLVGKFYYTYKPNGGEHSRYFDIHTWITWDNKNRFNFFGSTENTGQEIVEFKLHQIVID